MVCKSSTGTVLLRANYILLWFDKSLSSSWKLSLTPSPLTPPPKRDPSPPHSPLPWPQRETSLRPDSGFSQSVKLLPRRVGDFMAAPLLVAPSGAPRSRWTSVCGRVHRASLQIPHNYFYNDFTRCLCCGIQNLKKKKIVINDLLRVKRSLGPMREQPWNREWQNWQKEREKEKVYFDGFRVKKFGFDFVISWDLDLV